MIRRLSAHCPERGGPLSDPGNTARGNDGPRVLVLDEEIPFPMNTGKRLRTLNLLRRLSKTFRIDLLVHEGGATDSRIATLRTHGITVHLAKSHLPAKTGPRFYLRLASNLLSLLPYTVASHRQEGYRKKLESLLANNQYNLIHCEWTPYAIYRTSDCIPWVISAHNVESDVWSRLASADPNPIRRAFLKLQAMKMLVFERKVFSTAQFATAVSDNDAGRIKRWGGTNVQVVPNGVDLDECSVQPATEVVASNVLFVGSMDWRANQDAVRWYLNEIHPLVRSLTDYRLWLIGRNPPGWLIEEAKESGNVVVTGEVPDVKPYLARSSIVIVPLRVGGGSRLKILEAFACGRPVVSTTVGAEGLEIEPGRDLHLADEPQEFAEAVNRLLRDPLQRADLVHAARQLVEARYGWDTIADTQARFWRMALTGRPMIR